jgi:DNA-binding transcriptional LysR family regulator
MSRSNGQVDWEDLHYFLVLSQHGAVRPAGLALGVSHTTVSRRVEALEEQLGTRLFDRHRDGFVLTEDGRQLMATASRIAEEVANVSRDLSGRDGRLEGPVRITCGDEFMAAWILNALAPWCAAHPGVDLCIHTDFRLFDLAKGEADLALRVVGAGARPPDHLVGTVVAPLTVANYVATTHAERLCPGLPAARWLGFTDPRPVRALLASGSYPDLPVWGAFSTLDLVVRAARAGLGLAMLPTYVAEPDPTLQRLPQADVRMVAEIWLLHHPDLRGNARVRGARSELRAAFHRDSLLFRGHDG